MPSVWPGNFEANQLLVTKQEVIFQTGHREWALLITGLSPLRGLFLSCAGVWAFSSCSSCIPQLRDAMVIFLVKNIQVLTSW